MGSLIDSPATRLRAAIDVTEPGAQNVPPSGGHRNTRFCIGDRVREGMHFGTVTDVGTMLVQIKTTIGASRIVCPWELVRLRAPSDGHSLDSAHKNNTEAR
ncbi:mechanosensitive ion channel domain-containing protein [Mycolicibacterium gadium]|uniref:mechanosensitive ion channel domain-containing protein n=1 Tax=Mycolicibacterium gadium TaxID=1794 RepID=UPI00384DD860